MRRHGGGGDAAGMRARGIARGGGRGVGGGWFQFILWVLPTRSSLSNPVGQSVRCSHALSRSSSSLAQLRFLFRFCIRIPSLTPSSTPPALLALIRITVLFFFAVSFFSPSLFFPRSIPSPSIATVYVYNITHSFAPREQQRRYNIKKKLRTS